MYCIARIKFPLKKGDEGDVMKQETYQHLKKNIPLAP
jgi:hypothetical protein